MLTDTDWNEAQHILDEDQEIIDLYQMDLFIDDSGLDCCSAEEYLDYIGEFENV